MGMALNYVANWTIVDAVREIFQNSLDEEIQNPENKWYFNYDTETGTLRIGNKQSRLATKTLLLGATSKAGDSNTIGQHGEGYKVAIIVLLRSGKGVKIYNYNEKEIWQAKIIKSRRYQTEIGVFDVDKMGVLKRVPEHSLIFEITGITAEEYEAIKKRNLWLQTKDEIGEVFDVPGYGRILMDASQKGKVFVKGLYVCDKGSALTYGYDLEPHMVNLDRDRGLVDTWDLQLLLGEMFIHTNKDMVNSVKSKWEGGIHPV